MDIYYILPYYCNPKLNSFIIVNLSSIFSDKSKMLLCNCYWIVENPGLKIIFDHLMYLTWQLQLLVCNIQQGASIINKIFGINFEPKLTEYNYFSCPVKSHSA